MLFAPTFLKAASSHRERKTLSLFCTLSQEEPTEEKWIGSSYSGCEGTIPGRFLASICHFFSTVLYCHKGHGKRL